jgi:hypothetical protein
MAAAAQASSALMAAVASCSLSGVGKYTSSPFSEVEVTSTVSVNAKMAPGSSPRDVVHKLWRASRAPAATECRVRV